MYHKNSYLAKLREENSNPNPKPVAALLAQVKGRPLLILRLQTYLRAIRSELSTSM